jgi:hypothetical protein
MIWYDEAKRVQNIKTVQQKDPDFITSYCIKAKENREKLDLIRMIYEMV